MAALKDVMTKNVVVAKPSDNLLHIRQLLVDHEISRVVIVNERFKPVGIITDKDLLRHVTTDTSGKALDELPISTVMSKPPVSVAESTAVHVATKKMIDLGISSLVVVDGNETLTGIVTKTDLCMFYASNGRGRHRVEEYMTKELVMAHASQPVFYAAHLMATHKLSRIPIVNDRLEGIITLSDMAAVSPALSPRTIVAKSRPLLMKGMIVPAKSVHLLTIRDIMTRDPITISSNADLADAAKLMITHRISGLPVLNKRKQLVGVVTKTDIGKATASIR